MPGRCGGAQKAGYSPQEIVGFLTQSKPDQVAPAKPGLLEDIGTGVISTANKVLGAWDKGAVAIDDRLPIGCLENVSGRARRIFGSGKDMQQYGNENSPQRGQGNLLRTFVCAICRSCSSRGWWRRSTARSQALQDQGVPEDVANRAGAVEGAIQAGVQMLPLGKIGFDQGAKQLATSALGATAKAGAAALRNRLQVTPQLINSSLAKATTRRQSSLSHH